MKSYSINYSLVFKVLIATLLTSVIPTSALPWGVSAGMFSYTASDFYSIPDDYGATGYRGGFYVHLLPDNPVYLPVKGYVYSYSGLDNVFEFCPEVGAGFEFGEGESLTSRVEPMLGYGWVKHRRPMLHIPEDMDTNTSAGYLRVGLDVNAMHDFGGFTLGGNLGYRFLLNVGDDYDNANDIDLNIEVGYRVSETMRISLAGGAGMFGYHPVIYDPVLVNDELWGAIRPYAEIGVHFN